MERLFGTRLAVIAISAVSIAGCAGGTGSVARSPDTTPVAESSQPTADPTSTTATSTTTSTTRATRDPGDHLTVADFAGFMGRSTWYGVIAVDNDASQPVVITSGDVVYRSGSGAVIERDYLFNRILYPGINYIPVWIFNPATSPEEVDVRYDRAQFVDAARFVISDLDIRRGSFRTVELRGEIASTFAEDQTLVELIVVFFAADGKLLFSERSFVSLVEAGGSTLFSETVYLDEQAPSWDRAEVHAHP